MGKRRGPPCIGCKFPTWNLGGWCPVCLEHNGGPRKREPARDNLRQPGRVAYCVDADPECPGVYLALRVVCVNPSDRSQDVLALLCRGTEQECDRAVERARRRAA